MKFISFNSIVVAALALMATGCTTTNNSNSKINGLILPEPLSALEIVSQESQKALNAQKLLVTYREAYSNTLDYRQKNFMVDKVKVDYLGKPQALLNSIAIRYGYRFIEYGAKREMPTVNYTNYWGTPEGILVNLNAQLSKQGSISVNRTSKVITLKYNQKQR